MRRIGAMKIVVDRKCMKLLAHTHCQVQSDLQHSQISDEDPQTKQLLLS